LRKLYVTYCRDVCVCICLCTHIAGAVCPTQIPRTINNDTRMTIRNFYSLLFAAVIIFSMQKQSCAECNITYLFDTAT